MYLILGQVFALLTALCWAQNSLIYSHLGKKAGSDAVTHIRLWLALPIMLVVNFLFTGEVLPQDLPIAAFVYIFISGLLGFFVADLFLFRAFVEIGAREARHDHQSHIQSALFPDFSQRDPIVDKNLRNPHNPGRSNLGHF